MSQSSIKSEDFPISEVPGQPATQEQVSMFYTRYRFLAEFCRDCEVLEVACGGGQGLGYLARAARQVTGGDIDDRILPHVAAYYVNRSNIKVQHIDALDLPFAAQCFDVVAMLDAIYWLNDQDRFISEARRVLRPNGLLFISTVNKRWREFNPSPYATRYLDASELKDLLTLHGFHVEIYTAFPAAPSTTLGGVITIIRRWSVALGVVPSSIRLKALLKRIFIGKLVPLMDEVVDGMGAFEMPTRKAPPYADETAKLIYAVARII